MSARWPPGGPGEVIDMTGLLRAQHRARKGVAPVLAADASRPDVAGVLALLRQRFAELADECRLIGTEIDGHLRAVDDAAARLARRAHLMVEVEQAIAILSQCDVRGRLA